jgi:hypothetical protein
VVLRPLRFFRAWPGTRRAIAWASPFAAYRPEDDAVSCVVRALPIGDRGIGPAPALFSYWAGPVVRSQAPPLAELLDCYWIALSRWIVQSLELQSLATPYHRPSLRSSASASARSWLVLLVLCYGTQLELIVSFNSLPVVCLNQFGDTLGWHRYCGKQTLNCSNSLL